MTGTGAQKWVSSAEVRLSGTNFCLDAGSSESFAFSFLFSLLQSFVFSFPYSLLLDGARTVIH